MGSITPLVSTILFNIFYNIIFTYYLKYVYTIVFYSNMNFLYFSSFLSLHINYKKN